MINLEEFLNGYIRAALWSSTYAADNNGYPVDPNDTTNYSDIPMDDNFSAEDIAPETLDKMREDCADFVESNSDLLNAYVEKMGTSEYTGSEVAGHDFWLTRNGHGAGFWDRDLGDLGNDLTKAAKGHGSFDLYVGDDGKVYGN